MIVLAFDTSLTSCTAGVWRDDTVVASESIVLPQGHAEALMPMIERVIGAAGIDYTVLDRIAVTVGPGSFTGLRVGIATARGLAMAAQKPAFGVTTTEALAAAVPKSERHDSSQIILSIIDSKRDDVFAQAFAMDGTPTTEILNVGYENLPKTFTGRLIVVGDATAKALPHLGPEAKASSAPPVCAIEQIAVIAARRVIDPRGPLPVYVRAPDVTMRPDGGILRP